MPTVMIHPGWFCIDKLIADREVAPKVNPLTPRQAQLLQLVAYGLSRQQIAKRLGVSERSVNNTMGETYRRLHVNNAIDAIRWGKRLGVIVFA